MTIKHTEASCTHTITTKVPFNMSWSETISRQLIHLHWITSGKKKVYKPLKQTNIFKVSNILWD